MKQASFLRKPCIYVAHILFNCIFEPLELTDDIVEHRFAALYCDGVP